MRNVKDDSKVPRWLYGWQSPWKGRVTGGELVQKGEEELYHLGIRVRERFPDLFSDDYNSDTYQIRATQVNFEKKKSFQMIFLLPVFHFMSSWCFDLIVRTKEHF